MPKRPNRQAVNATAAALLGGPQPGSGCIPIQLKGSRADLIRQVTTRPDRCRELAGRIDRLRQEFADLSEAEWQLVLALDDDLAQTEICLAGHPEAGRADLAPLWQTGTDFALHLHETQQCWTCEAVIAARLRLSLWISMLYQGALARANRREEGTPDA